MISPSQCRNMGIYLHALTIDVSPAENIIDWLAPPAEREVYKTTTLDAYGGVEMLENLRITILGII